MMLSLIRHRQKQNRFEYPPQKRKKTQSSPQPTLNIASSISTAWTPLILKCVHTCTRIRSCSKRQIVTPSESIPLGPARTAPRPEIRKKSLGRPYGVPLAQMCFMRSRSDAGLQLCSCIVSRRCVLRRKKTTKFGYVTLGSCARQCVEKLQTMQPLENVKRRR